MGAKVSSNFEKENVISVDNWLDVLPVRKYSISKQNYYKPENRGVNK
jgi:hypothetical protein